MGPLSSSAGHVAEQPQSLGHLIHGARRHSVVAQAILHAADRLRIEPVSRGVAAQERIERTIAENRAGRLAVARFGSSHSYRWAAVN